MSNRAYFSRKLRRLSLARTHLWSGAQKPPCIPFKELHQLIDLVSDIEGVAVPAFLVFAAGELQIPYAHPIWSRQVIYAVFSRGSMRYLGGSVAPRRRLSLHTGAKAHEHVGPLLAKDIEVSVYLVPVEVTADWTLERQFLHLENYGGARKRAQREASRRITLLNQIFSNPGITRTQLATGHKDREILKELLTAGEVVEVPRASKTNRTKYAYYAPSAYPDIAV